MVVYIPDNFIGCASSSSSLANCCPHRHMHSMLTLWLFHIFFYLQCPLMILTLTLIKGHSHAFSILFQYGEHVAKSNLKNPPQLKSYWWTQNTAM